MNDSIAAQSRPDFWIQTANGSAFNFERPDHYKFDIDTIAKSLSQLNRYVGHCFLPYNVAQHSILVARYIQDQGYETGAVLYGLLHDAVEMCTGDISGPYKKFIGTMTPALKIQEDYYERELFRQMGVTPYVPKYKDLIKEVDLRITLDEKAQLIPESIWKWDIELQGMQPLGIRVLPMPHFTAECEFKEFYEKLKKDLAHEY